MKLLTVFVFLMPLFGAVQGYLDVANCGIVSGWAWDSASPNTPITVEILDNGVSVTKIQASALRTDLRDARPPIGNGQHAFTYTANFTGSESHVVAVRVGNVVLFNSPRVVSGCAGTGGALPGWEYAHRLAAPPTGEHSACTMGDFSFDATYDYKCTGPNLWKRLEFKPWQ